MKESEKSGAVVVNGQEYPYKLRRSRRAKHVLLHVSSERGIEVVVPQWAAYRAGEDFLTSKRAWLVRALEHYERRRANLPTRSLVSGTTLPLLDGQRTLAIHRDSLLRRPRVAAAQGVLHLHVCEPGQVRPLLVSWYRRAAREYFAATTAALAAATGRRVARLRIGEQKTQWGSASARGVVSLNWRLMLGPETVARYVAAHEVAHLTHRRHSRDFWRCVAHLHPAYRTDRAWLKEHGHTLVL